MMPSWSPSPKAERLLGISKVTIYRWLRDGFITGGHSEVQGYRGFPEGRGVAGWAGRRLACRGPATGRCRPGDRLVAAFDEVARTRRVRRSVNVPGQVLAEVAVMIADGGEAIADLAVLRNQPGLFGLVASPATCWRVLDAVDADMLAALKQARAGARERKRPSTCPGACEGYQRPRRRARAARPRTKASARRASSGARLRLLLSRQGLDKLP
jgi:hypothetical protein